MKGNFSNLIVLLLIFLNSSVLCNAQQIPERKGVALIGGIGNYEWLHGGVHLPLHYYFFEGAIGIKPWNFNKDQYVMEYICFGRTLFHLSPELNTALQLKLLQWNYSDDYTKISAIGIGPEVRLTGKINSHLQMTLSGGALYNEVLKYERKTNEEVGWFNKVGPSFSFQLNYSLR